MQRIGLQPSENLTLSAILNLVLRCESKLASPILSKGNIQTGLLLPYELFFRS